MSGSVSFLGDGPACVTFPNPWQSLFDERILAPAQNRSSGHPSRDDLVLESARIEGLKMRASARYSIME